MLRAARKAGVKVCSLLDSNGYTFPVAHFFEGAAVFWNKQKCVEGFVVRTVSTTARVVYFGVKYFFWCWFKYLQMKEADLIVLQTPQALYGHCELIEAFRGEVSRFPLKMLGYPIPMHFKAGRKSPRKLIAVGRWDDLKVKRPRKLIEIIDLLLLLDPKVTVELYGLLPPLMTSWHEGLRPEMRARVTLHGLEPSPAVAEAMSAAQVLLATSLNEGVPLVVLEALCSGCTVTGLDSRYLPALRWAAMEGDATLAKNDEAATYANAVLREFELWESGKRNAAAIAEKWGGRLLADNFARNLVQTLAGGQGKTE
jgi:glycosyltransferase involved in cell wall biosynthesis